MRAVVLYLKGINLLRLMLMDDSHLRIFTDGSFCPNTGCSGFGVCLVEDEDKKVYKKHKGRFHLTVRNSITAELIALCMGVIHAHETLDFKLFKRITIVTDAPGVREAFRRVQRKGPLFTLTQKALDLMNAFNIRIQTIKGHQPKHSSYEAFFNHRCDVMAKREMRQWRDSEFPMAFDEEGKISRRRERRINRAQAKQALRSKVPDLW